MKIQKRNKFIGLILLFIMTGCGQAQVKDSVDVVEKNIPKGYLEASMSEEKENEQISSSEEVKEDEIITFTVSCAGDCSLGNHKDQDYANSFCQMYDLQKNPAYFFKNVYDIFSDDDMTIVNLEGALTSSNQYRPNRTFNIKGDPEYVKILTEGSVEAVSMGNNHRADYGDVGVRDTVEALESENIVYAYDSNVGIYENKGIRVGIISVNEASDGKGVEKYITQGIDSLKEAEVDLIFVCCHWGIEKDYYPKAYQTELGHKCIDWGADLVIGHHPHVLQGVEVYQGKYILYSLGNFSFGANRNPSDKDTVIFQQTFTFINGEKQEDAKGQVIPCRVSSVNNRNDYCPTPSVGEERERILKRIQEFSAPFQTKMEDGIFAEN